MERLTTTIRREWLCDIIAERKTVEYREIKPYWTKQLEGRQCPFSLRLINGRRKNVPEVTVQIDQVRKNLGTGHYELVIGRVIAYRNWDKENECPVAQPAIEAESLLAG